MTFANLNHDIDIIILENLDYVSIKMLADIKINSGYTLVKYMKMIRVNRDEIFTGFAHIENNLEIIERLIGWCSNEHAAILWQRAMKDFSLFTPVIAHPYRPDPHHIERIWAEFASRGNLEMIKLFHQNNLATHSRYLAEIATRNRRHAIVKYLLDHEFTGPSWSAGIMEATYNNDIPMLELFLQYNTIRWSADAMDFAARLGQLNVIKFLHENRTEGCTTDAMDFAAMRGRLDIVKFLNENRAEGYVYAMDRAATYGHFDIVKYLYENAGGRFANLLQTIRHLRLHGDPNIPIVDWLTSRYQLTPEQEWLIDTMVLGIDD